MENHQSKFIFSFFIQLDYRLKRFTCVELSETIICVDDIGEVFLSIFLKTLCIHLFYNEKIIKPISVFASVFIWDEINYRKPMWLSPCCFAQLFELLFGHILTDMVVENTVFVFLVLRKQTKEIWIFSACLTRQFKVIMTPIQIITIWMSSANIVCSTFILF